MLITPSAEGLCMKSRSSEARLISCIVIDFADGVILLSLGEESMRACNINIHLSDYLTY